MTEHRTIGLADLLRRTIRLLPDGQRDWGEAMLAEGAAVPFGGERRRWLIGALWLVVRRSRILSSGMVALLMVGTAVGIVAFGWHDDWINPATPVNRIFLLAIVGVLLLLPIVCGSAWAFGPGARNAPARVLRFGGYLAVSALLPIAIGVGNFAGERFARCGDCSPAEQQQWHTERVGDAISGSLVIAVLVTAYAVGILWITSRRASATPSGLSIGGGCAIVGGAAVYGLAPTGKTLGGGTPGGGTGWLSTVLALAVVLLILGTPIIAGFWSAKRALSVDPPDDELKQGILTGLLTASVGALLIVVLTIPTMLIFPTRVPLKWANPSPLVPHGTVFEIQMSLGDAAAGYEVWLLLAPVFGAVLGAAGAGLATVTARKRLRETSRRPSTARRAWRRVVHG